ncbi:MAG: exodeoxyribonuclease III [Rickettsiales bacterium]
MNDKKNISIASWNVNSVRSRLSHLLDWLKNDSPDIVLLQELKCTDDMFPAMEIEEVGYNIAIHGEKSYNGVAILSKFPLDDVERGLPEKSQAEEVDKQARYIEAVTTTPCGVFRVASVYVPNGQEITSDKFIYKLGFLDSLYEHSKTLLSYGESFVIGGDYNIAPDDRDVHSPEKWKDSVLTHYEVRSRLRKILALGVYDACRASKWDGNSEYSWWDYRANAFASDNGLRIDHLLLSPQAVDKLDRYWVEKKLRSLDKPSDHAPVVAKFVL